MDGDGYPELLVGAAGYQTSDEEDSAYGVVHVVSSVGRGAHGIEEAFARIEGLRTYAPFAGFGCDGIAGGDFNGDGVGDVAFGIQMDPMREEDADWIGAVYVYHGPLSGVYSLADADARLRASDELLDSIASGDLNGDGVDDLLVPVRSANVSEVDSGAVYVSLGPISGDHGLDDDVVISGGYETRRAGQRVASAGDVDGDGTDDVLASALSEHWEDEATRGEDSDHATFLFRGPIDADLSFDDAAAVFRSTTGPGLLNNCGARGIGDFDGDGHTDIAACGAGAVTVVFGPFEGEHDVAEEGLTLYVTPESHESVIGAGDVDGDGFDDLLIGGAGAEAFLVYGRPGHSHREVDVGELSCVFRVTGGGAKWEDPGYGYYFVYDDLAESVAAADFDGDGRNDLVLGTPRIVSPNVDYTGWAYVLYASDLPGVP